MKLKLSPILTLNNLKRISAVIVLVGGFLFLFNREKSAVLMFNEFTLLDFLPQTQCGVVLTGSAGRIREGFEVLAQKKIDKLIISGVYKDTKLNEIFPHLPFYPEINPEDVILEKISGSTYGNAVQSLLVAETLRCKNILLITSNIHMHRSYKTFRAIFPTSVGIEKYPVTHPARENTVFDVYLETIKSLFYNLLLLFAGWIP